MVEGDHRFKIYIATLQPEAVLGTPYLEIDRHIPLMHHGF